MNRETSSLISLETIKAIIKKEVGVNLYDRVKSGVDLELHNHAIKTKKSEMTARELFEDLGWNKEK